MIRRIPRQLLMTAALLLPSLALAHPGHSAFDPTQMPHAGHEWERIVVIVAMVVVLAFAVRAVLKGRR
jgi:hypothetical protein